MILIVLMVLLVQLDTLGQKRSIPQKPEWLRKLPTMSDAGSDLKVVYVESEQTLLEARVLSKTELIASIRKGEVVDVEEVYSNTSVLNESTNNEDIESSYSLKVTTQGNTFLMNYEKVDEYWELFTHKGRKGIRLYTLYLLKKTSKDASSSSIYISRRYGLNGIARSIIPGWGQFYKGSNVKGGLILGGEIAMVSTIIVAENLRASYDKKRREYPKYLDFYNKKADDWENIRNVMIGSAACLYLYNLIDAIVAPGGTRVQLRKQRSMTFIPKITTEQQGLSMVFMF